MRQKCKQMDEEDETIQKTRTEERAAGNKQNMEGEAANSTRQKTNDGEATIR